MKTKYLLRIFRKYGVGVVLGFLLFPLFGLAQTNLAPSISIGTPTNGQIFAAPMNIQISAEISYRDTPTNVEFFANGNDLGRGILMVSSGFGGAMFLTWTNPPPGHYTLIAVGTDAFGVSSTSAPVNITIKENLTNPPPVVRITNPTNEAIFIGPTNISLTAVVSGLDNLANVEFFAGTNDIGQGEQLVVGIVGYRGPSLYWLNWQTVPPGDYVLSAVVTDNQGVSVTSAPVNIIVGPNSRSTNQPPVARIIGPANGAVFHAPVNIPITAFAYDLDGALTAITVQFFAGTNSLGFGSLLPVSAIVCPNCPPQPDYLLVWSNAPVGNYELTAVASDSGSTSTTSAPVQITVLPSVSPPTNHPSVVNVVATDPVAIVSTNSWVWPGETNSPPIWNAWPITVPLWHTNSGPKTAAFAVSRFGFTNTDLTVTYELDGSASNGVDYVALPGFVVIPAGQRHAMITIVPIDNGLSVKDKVVVLTLTVSTDSPPDYLLGVPRRSAALIVDTLRPIQASGMTQDRYFHFRALGPDGAWFSIESATNFANWTPVCTNQVINGSIDFIDPYASDNQTKFYRAIPLDNSPGE